MLDDEINAITYQARHINDEFHKIAKEAYQFARTHHANPKYEAFRNSDEGRDWKKGKLTECNHRCPERNKLINDNNSSIDHKHPRRHYPWLTWEISNLWVLCRDCNKNKGDRSWDEYLNAIKVYRGQAAVNRVLKYAPTAKLSGE